MKTDQQIYIALAILALGAGGLYLTQKNKAADQSSHCGSAVSTSRMTLLSTRTGVIRPTG